VTPPPSDADDGGPGCGGWVLATALVWLIIWLLWRLSGVLA
jgi:hypothetical protein